MRNRHHGSTGRLLDAWVDGELNPARGGSRAGRHVAECWDCRPLPRPPGRRNVERLLALLGEGRNWSLVTGRSPCSPRGAASDRRHPARWWPAI